MNEQVQTGNSGKSSENRKGQGGLKSYQQRNLIDGSSSRPNVNETEPRGTPTTQPLGKGLKRLSFAAKDGCNNDRKL